MHRMLYGSEIGMLRLCEGRISYMDYGIILIKIIKYTIEYLLINVDIGY